MIVYTHANDKGTGTQMSVDTTPAKADRAGFVTIGIRKQVGTRRFDGSSQFSAVEMAIIDIPLVGVMHLINALEGRDEANISTKGIKGRGETYSSVVFADPVSEPYAGYAIHIKTAWANGEKSDGRIIITATEAQALVGSLRSAMHKIAFG